MSKFGASTEIQEDTGSRFGASSVVEPLTTEQVLGGGIQEPVKPVQQGTSIGEDIVAGAAELASGINRGVLGAVDFFTTDQVNALLQLSGSEKRIPSLSIIGEEFGAPPAETFLPGQTGRTLGAAGEVIPAAVGIGGLLRKGVQQLPALAEASETAIRGVVRQLGKTTVGADVGLGAASGGGAQIGEEEGGDTGALVGSFLAPVTATGVKSSIEGLLKLGKRGVQSLIGSVEGMSDDGAAKLLAEAMIKSELGPDDIAKRIKDLGPEAIPADAGETFTRLLKAASNKIPRISGQAKEVLNARDSGKGNRLLGALDDATGTASLSVDDEIIRINKALAPEIREAYTAARAKSDIVFAPKPVTPEVVPLPGVGLSGAGLKKVVEKPVQTRLEKLLSGEGVAGSKVKSKVDLELKAKRLSGETVSKLDTIDATKRALDDEIQKSIREGSSNKGRSLVILKNSLLKEADKAIPEYKKARDLFAGKAALESAADQGSLFLKMKSRDVVELNKSFGESEKRFYKLGAKQAIADKIDDIQTTADTVRRLFGKGGDVKKLRSLFDDQKSFDRFSNTLEKEAQFIATRRAIQGNSTTAQQALDVKSASEILGDTIELTSSPVGAARFFGKVLKGFSAKKGSDENLKAFEDVGDLLLAKGINPERISDLIRKGNKKDLQAIMKNVLKKELTSKAISQITTAVLQDREIPDIQ